MKPLPGPQAPTKEFDEFFDEYFPQVQQAALSAGEFIEYLNGKQETVKDRAAHINSIPSQARWFFKFRPGISDTLKGKCLPRNKHTVDIIKMLLNSAQSRQKGLQLPLKAGHIYNSTNTESKKPFLLKVFAEAYLKGAVEDYVKFEAIGRKQYKTAVADEKTAIELLNIYLKDKAAMKEAPPDEYKKFKTAYELVAKNLKD